MNRSCWGPLELTREQSPELVALDCDCTSGTFPVMSANDFPSSCWLVASNWRNTNAPSSIYYGHRIGTKVRFVDLLVSLHLE